MTRLTENPKENIELVKAASKVSFPNNQVLADLCSVQAILESGLRGLPSQLALKYCNLFGIKGLGEGSVIDGKKINVVRLPTHEYYHGVMHEVDASFAVNDSIEQSFEQHKKLLELPRYRSVMEATTFEDAALQIRLDGYATDPSYTNELIEVYKKYIKT